MSGIVKAPCAICIRETSHDILHTTPEIGSGGFHQIFDTLQCRGCESVSLREMSFWSINGEIKCSPPQYYPPPISRKLPDWAEWKWMIGPAEEAFWDILREVYAATRNGLPQLAVMGIRAILEQVMISKVGDHGSFFAHLEAFKEAGYISLVQFDHLNTILGAGHAVIHRGHPRLTEEDLNTALDIMEGTLAPIYHHQDASERLSERVPARPTKRKPSKPEAPP
jgi:hypothetical protein